MPLTIPDWFPDKIAKSNWKYLPLTIPVNSQIKLDSYLYIYLLSYSIGKVHAQSIYPKHPYTHFKGNQKPIQRKTSVGYIQQVLHQIESN